MSVWKLARAILPKPIQEQLANRHYVKRQTLDPLIFNFTSHPAEEKLLFEESPTKNVPPETLEQNPFMHPPMAERIRKWYAKPQHQQVVRVRGDVLIEPKTGWPVGLKNEIYASLYPTGAINPYLGIPDYSVRWKKTPQVKLDKIISMRDLNEQGYFHFYSDMMSRLLLIKQAGLNLADYTLVFAKYIGERHYVQVMLERCPLFAEIGGVYLQQDEFITSHEAIFPHVFAMPSSSGVFLDVIEAAKAAGLNPDTDYGDRKIFLTRGAHRRRVMRNADEILEILRPLGFEGVDADDLSLSEQMELFAGCRHLVGVHGAGLVNTLYRYPKKMSLFEAHDPPLKFGFNPSYHNMAVTLGYDYGATYGEDSINEGVNFYMPPDRFEKEYMAFWQACGD